MEHTDASSDSAKQNHPHAQHSLFPGGGQMGELMRAYNWKNHALGDPAHWPASLQTGLRMILHSGHPMFIWWSEQLYMFHNDAYLPALGDKHPQALGAQAQQMWSEIWWQIGGIVEDILKGGPSFYAEELHIELKRKGFMEETYWTFSYSSMPDDQGKINGIFCACNEVTWTVLAKRRQQTTKDMAEILAGLPTMEQVCQTACQVMAANPQDIPFSLIYLLQENASEARLMGYSADLPEPLVQPLIVLSESDKAIWPLLEVQQHKQPAMTVLPHFPHESETDLPHKAVILPVFQPGGEQMMGFLILGVSDKLTYDEVYQIFHKLLAGQIANSLASVQTSMEVERQKDRLERFFMQAPAAICVAGGPDLVFELVNPIYQQLFPNRPLLGRALLEALPEIADQPIWYILQEVLQTGETFKGEEVLVRLARQQGAPLEDSYFNFIYQARYDAQGKVDGVLVFAFEVTDLAKARKQLEQNERALQDFTRELAAANEELTAANEEISASNEDLSEVNEQLLRVNADLDNFIYAASHDLKAPITNIEGLLQTLERNLPAESLEQEVIKKLMTMMQSSVERFKKTIQELTEITKLQRDPGEDISQVSLAEVIAEVQLDLQPSIQEAGAQLSIEVSACPFIHFSAKNLRSIVYNLLSNALKYRSPTRALCIQIHCHETSSYQILSITDNGLGMNLSQQDKIFSMFKRLHHHVEGSGIGLYIVKKIIENAGGKIEVESQVEQGSTFRVFFRF